MHPLSGPAEGREFLYLVLGRYPEALGQLVEVVSHECGCFFEFPIVNERDRMLVPIVGHAQGLRRLQALLRDGFDHQVLALTGYSGRGTDVLASLTPTQRTCLLQAHRRGYYDLPRRTDLRELGRLLGISHAAVGEHLRKAEGRILDALLS